MNEDNYYNDYPSRDPSPSDDYENRNMPSTQNRSKSVTFAKDTIFNNQNSRMRNSLYPDITTSSPISDEDETVSPLIMKTYLHQNKKDPTPIINIPYI